MGDYTGLRFKGTVKKQFRNEFEPIALNGYWEDATDTKLRDFSNNSLAEFIPCGALQYMPVEWQHITYNEYGHSLPAVANDGFQRFYDKETGRWTFQCSLKNYDNTIEKFLDLMPYFIENVEILEVYFEYWKYSKLYDFVNGKMKVVNSKYKKYK